MSGGSMEYLYQKVEDADFEEHSALRKLFREHLNKVAKALKAIEWNDSGDGDPEENNLIRECLGKECDSLELNYYIKQAQENMTKLRDAIEKASIHAHSAWRKGN